MNCSIGRNSLTEGLDAATTPNVELWWPFAVPDPTDADIDAVVAELKSRNLTLVALNMFGGDLAAGDRGILHERDMPAAHLDAIERFHNLTGVPRFNLLVGRGGAQLTDQQVERFGAVARDVEKRFGGVVMIEPLSGAEDYPVKTLADAALLPGGLLLDLYHLAVNGPVDLNGVMPEHVQIADSPGRGAPGTGSLPLAEWVQQLRDAGYGGHVAGEWLP
ncbi:Hydroxypyruvate isomerase [Corynebacterium comes]|uniref:Hydroxypyruvate isomerase n=2 Tax=Corynebacterium comes TaxID=2675218 RepID=A0A6B8VT00_9CORY|nr:Hydroxypyruvate isomerase [Corynebacterium comes]